MPWRGDSWQAVADASGSRFTPAGKERNQFDRGQDPKREAWTVQFVGGAHHFLAEGPWRRPQLHP